MLARSATARSSLSKTLAFTAVVEFGTGLVLIIDPAIVIRLLLGVEFPDAGTLLGRFFGISLVALAVACWPQRQRVESLSPPLRGMLIYNVVIALYLAALGTIGHLGGLLLWPAVALHAAVAVGLGWTSRNESEPTTNK